MCRLREYKVRSKKQEVLQTSTFNLAAKREYIKIHNSKFKIH